MSNSINTSEIKTVIFACEAGMGSSLMSVNSLKKKLKKANVSGVTVVHKPAREIPANAQLVVVHEGLAKVAKSKAPDAVKAEYSPRLCPAADTTLRLFPNMLSAIL